MDIGALVSRVAQLIRLEKFVVARQAIAEGLQLDAENRDLLLYAAEVEFLTGNHAQAAQLTDRLVGRFPDWCRPFYLRARLLAERPDVEGAVAAIREAISLFPYEPEYHARLGQYLLLERKYSESLAATDWVLATHPTHVLALLVRSRALYFLGSKEEADATYRAALAAEPANPYSHMNYGIHLVDEGDYGRAGEHLRSALRLRPTDPRIRKSLIGMYKRESALYRRYLGSREWLRNRDGANQVWIAVIVPFTFGVNAILSAVPYPASAFYLVFGVSLFLAVGSLSVTGEVLSNWVLWPAERRTLLDSLSRQRTYVITLLYGLWAAAAGLYIITGSITWLTLAIYSVTLLLPAYVRGEPFLTSKAIRRLSIALAVVAGSGVLAVAFSIVPWIFHVLYIFCLAVLIGKLSRKKRAG